MPADKARTLIADDHPLFIEGLHNILRNEERLDLYATANNGAEALAEIRRGGYHLLITDIGMPVMDGIELTRQAKADFPELKVLVLSMYDDQEIVLDALDAEADGYVLKNSGKRDLMRAVDCILDGGAYYSSELIPMLSRHIATRSTAAAIPLSPREIEILKLICNELSTRDIAEKLFISPRTVETHRKHILRKAGVTTLVGLIKYAFKHGLAE